jgi:hypothetical protein
MQPETGWTIVSLVADEGDTTAEPSANTGKGLPEESRLPA